MAKRSRTVALAIVGAAAFTLAGCRDEQVEAQAFPDLQSCRDAANSDGLFSASECDTAFAQAETLHVETAPRYESQALCEEEHGAGACGSEAQATQDAAAANGEVTQGGGSGSIFMPLMMGMLIGNMLGGARAGVAPSQPMYRTPTGGYKTAGGTSTYSSNTGKASLGSSLFSRPAATVGQAPMTRASVASRGGFGSSGAARSGFGG